MYAPTVLATGEADVVLVVVLATGGADIVLVVVLATGEADVVLVVDDSNDKSSYRERPFGPPQISVTLPSQVIEHRPSVTKLEPAKSVLPQ